jgi:hypothetical protein
MRKNKLYLILAIITSLTLFTTAAICNQCQGQAEEKTSEREEAYAEEKMEEEIAEEESIEEEATEEEEQSSQQEGQAEAPTIELQIYEGPTYLSGDDVCYYLIKAIVTGSPAPDIEFSKDDSNGALLPKKVQINLNDPSETYTLTTIATNLEGTATDSITLNWGCPIPNNPPELSEITLMGNHYIGFEYTISAAATDLDGDSITYNWSVDGGSLNNPNANPVKWTMPNTAGNYNITVTVDDGNGGQDEKTETVEVLAMPCVRLPLQIWEGGAIEEGTFPIVYGYAVVGDSVQDRTYRGFLSFDISSLAGKEVTSAEMKFEQFHISGDPYSIIEKIWVEAVYWGTGLIELEDYYLQGVTLGGYNIPTFTCSSNELRDALNQAIDDGHDRFQIRLRHKGFKTNHDGIKDAITSEYPFKVEFNATYMP